MYESPITNYISEIYDKQMAEEENFILTTVSKTIGIDVNREELIKALNYDRQQYEKGYADAKAEYEPMLDKIRDEICDIDDEIVLNPDSFYDRKVYVRFSKVIDIIDKYKKESKEEDKE